MAWINFDFPRSRSQAKEITEQMIEDLAAEGLTRKQMAKALGMKSRSGLDQRFRNSLTLQRAEERGKERFAAKEKE